MRKKGEEKNAEEAELDPARVRSRQSETDLESPLGQMDVEADMDVGREYGNSTLSTGTPKSGSGVQPDMVPVPDAPSLSAQLPTSRDNLDVSQPLQSSFDRECAPSHAPMADGTHYDILM